MGKAFHLCDVVCYGFVLLEVDFCFKCVVDDNQFVRVVVTCLTAFELKRLVFFATNVASLTGLAFVVKIVCINCLVAIKNPVIDVIPVATNGLRMFRNAVGM